MACYTACPTLPQNPIYKPLDEPRKEIRVLHLQPGEAPEVLVGSLEVIASALANRTVRYEAISYCWGETKSGGTMILESLTIDIPASAEQVLRALRDVKDVRKFWIDAICINQFDLGERAQQVTLMADIYRGAERTNIWLGEDDERTKSEIECLETFEAVLPQRTRDGSPPSGVGQYNAQMELLRTMSVSQRLDPEPLATLFARHYFRRIWVFQEVVLSSSALCHIGPIQFSWTRLELVANVILARFWDLEGSDNRVFETWDALMTLPIMTRLRKAVQVEGYQRVLSSLVIEGRNLQATDPKDKIYALLGLSSWVAEDKALPTTVAPNYKKSIKECFRDATRELTAECKGLHYLILCLEAELVRTTCEGHILPSWVPNFELADDERLMTPLPSGFSPHNLFNVVIRDHTTYGDDSVVLAGHAMPPIYRVFPPFEPEREHPLTQASRDLEDWVRTLGDGRTFTERMEVLCFTLLAGKFQEELLERESERCTVILALSARVLIGDAREFLSTECPLPRRMYMMGHLDRLEREMKSICKGRRLFAIDGYLGIGPANAQESDIVAILFGCPWPLVLRPIEQCFRLIGPCYVYGIMDGSLIKKELAKQTRWKDFVIQ